MQDNVIRGKQLTMSFFFFPEKNVSSNIQNELIFTGDAEFDKLYL